VRKDGSEETIRERRIVLLTKSKDALYLTLDRIRGDRFHVCCHLTLRRSSRLTSKLLAVITSIIRTIVLLSVCIFCFFFVKMNYFCWEEIHEYFVVFDALTFSIDSRWKSGCKNTNLAVSKGFMTFVDTS